MKYRTVLRKQFINNECNAAHSNKILYNQLTNYKHVTFFDGHSYFKQKNNPSDCLIIKNIDVLYFDDDHLSYQGTLIIEEELNKIIVSLVNEN